MSKHLSRGLLASIAAVLFVLPPVALGQAPSTDETSGPPTRVSPQIILSSQKQPVYPPAAFAARYTGSVLIEMTVQKDGTVGDVAVLNCTRPKVGFEDAAIAAVKQWRFEPGLNNGEPVEFETRLKLNFTRVGVGPASQAVVSAGAFQTALADTDRRVDDSSRRGKTPSPPPSSRNPR